MQSAAEGAEDLVGVEVEGPGEGRFTGGAVGAQFSSKLLSLEWPFSVAFCQAIVKAS